MKIRIVKQNKAVSEVLGTILLLAISVSIFSVVYASFFSVQVSPAMPSVNIVGSIDEGYLVLEHYGGESLSLDTKVIMYFDTGGSSTASIIINDYLDQTSKDDGKWDIGEKLKIPLNSISEYIPYNSINIMVVDTESNSAIMQGKVQEILEPQPIADLGVLSFGCNPSTVSDIGTDVSVSFSVKNLGEKPANGFGYTISIDGNIVVSDGIQNLNPALNLGEQSSTFSTVVTLPSVEPLNGNYYEIEFEIFVYGTIYNDDGDATSIYNIANAQVYLNLVDPNADLSISLIAPNNLLDFHGLVTISSEVVNNGPSETGNVRVICNLPVGLLYGKHSQTKGSYDKNTGVWNIGNLDAGESVSLTIKALVDVLDSEVEFTQFAIVIDGSNAISTTQFDMILQGIANAIIDGSIPHNGKIELTIIQMGQTFPNKYPSYSTRVEIPPTIINSVQSSVNYYQTIANQVLNIQKIGGYSPLANAIMLTTSTLSSSDNFDSDSVQIINFITDGMSNVRPIKKYPSGTDCFTIDGREVCITTEEDVPYIDIDEEDIDTYALNIEQRDLMITTLGLTADQDQINALGIDGTFGCNSDWLTDDFVWPQPGYDNWLPTGPGWYRLVDTSAKVKECLGYQITYLFNPRVIDAIIQGSDHPDNDLSNNEAQIIITPQ
jgi:hypothetical protein